MEMKMVEGIAHFENYKAESFRKRMEKHDGLNFEIFFPEDREKLGIAKGPGGFYHVIRAALYYDMGDGVHTATYDVADGTNALQSYEEFENQIEKGSYNFFDICLHKKSRGVFASNEGKVLEEDGNGYFCCVLKWTTGKKKDLDYAMFVFDPKSEKFSKPSYFEIDESMFDFMYDFIKDEGEYDGK